MELVVADPHRGDLAVIAKVHEGLPRALRCLAGQIRNQVMTVEMDLVRHVSDLVAIEALLSDLVITGDGQNCWQHVDVRADPVQRRASRDLVRPAEETRHAPTTLPSRVLLATEGRVGAVGPGVVLRTVVRGVPDAG